MGSIVSAITGGGSGSDFKAKEAQLLNPSTQAQADQQYGNVQDAYMNQQGFLGALRGQNGIQNQSNVFNQLQGVANGTGPNPAMAQLNNATGNNIQQQAALMAGQRGSGANAGLLARQAGMQGGNLQQQAAGQGAALQANQSMNALNQLGGMAGQQVAQQQAANQSLANTALSGQGQVLNSIQGQNNAAVGNASQQNQANASIAKEVSGQQGNLLGNMTGALGNAVMSGGKDLLGGVGDFFGNVGGFLGGGLSSLGAAGGGLMSTMGGPAAGEGLATVAAIAAEGGQIQNGTLVGKHGPQSHAGMYFAKGGKVPALVSPGEKYLSPKDMNAVTQGANPMAQGKTIPGKPEVSGAKDSYSNDTVKMNLDEGGLVLPRSVTQSKDPGKKAAEFVAAVMKQKALKK